jgi:catechol 2,3-dioxygenase-like lactoylglutathione lyase family enzyme
MPDMQGITHWALGVNDLAESERFYTDVVGWEPKGRLNPKMSCFGVCGLDVLLCECPQPDRSDTQRNLVHHSFTFTPEGWVEAAKHLRSKGVTPDEIIYRERGYFPGREIYFHDPSGNRIEFRDPTWVPGMPKPSFEEMVGETTSAS